MNESSAYEEINHFSINQKLNWFGYGEWVEEPDEVLFTYKDYECKVLRILQQEESNPLHFFGGYLCGYIRIPNTHPYHHRIFEKMEIDCHGGLTFGCVSIGHWVGFDCAHFLDYVPSLEKMIRSDLDLSIYTSYRMNRHYRNIKFCIKECKNIVDQLEEKAKTKEIAI